MREFLLNLARALLLVLMTVYLPVFWLAASIATLMRCAQDALEVQLIMARARRKVLSAVKRRHAP